MERAGFSDELGAISTPPRLPATEEPVIRVDALTKTYGKHRGVEDLTFDVRKGEVFGFLGPNGAGKTTTIRVLLDLLRPSAGNATVFGLDVRASRDEIHSRIGYLPGEVGLFERLSVKQQLEDFANLRGGLPDERIRDYAARFELDLERPLRALSKGNKQKVGLVQALMHEPELLILDEPTSGLDPLMQQRFYQVIREARAAGRTVFLSSHVLPEVEQLCDRVAIIREGKMLAISSVRDIRAKARRRITVRLRGPAPAAVLAGIAGVSEVRDDGSALHFFVSGALQEVLERLASSGIMDIETHEPSLEDVFLAYYGGGAP